MRLAFYTSKILFLYARTRDSSFDRGVGQEVPVDIIQISPRLYYPSNHSTVFLKNINCLKEEHQKFGNTSIMSLIYPEKSHTSVLHSFFRQRKFWFSYAIKLRKLV